MSHELRTPLNGILLLSEFLMENQSERLGDEEVEFSHAIHSAGQDLLALINDILDLSKVEAGKMNIEIEAVNITEIPEMVLQSFGQLSRKKSFLSMYTWRKGCRKSSIPMLSDYGKF